MNYFFFSGGVSSVSSQREMTQESHMYSTRVMVDGKIVDVTILQTLLRSLVWSTASWIYFHASHALHVRLA